MKDNFQQNYIIDFRIILNFLTDRLIHLDRKQIIDSNKDPYNQKNDIMQILGGIQLGKKMASRIKTVG